MATSRNRSRYRVDFKSRNPVVTEKGTFKAAAPIDSQLETMTDYITTGWAQHEIGWPQREIVRSNPSFPTRLGHPRGTDVSWSVRVNPLSYSCVSTFEQPSEVTLRLNVGNVFVTVDGPVIGSLKLIGGMNFPNPTLPSYLSYSDMIKVLKSDIMLKAQDPEYSFGEPLGELRASLKLIKDPIRSLFRMSKKFSLAKERARLASRTPKQYARAFASTYAKYQFGLAPLVRSVQDAIDANIEYMTYNYMKPQLEAIRMKMSSRASARHISKDTNLIIGSSVSALGTFFYDAETTVNEEREARVGLYHTKPTTATRREYLGLTAGDIPETVWQLMPYSFLIDRLINIKKWTNVSRLIFSSKVKFRGGWVIERTRNTRSESARLTGATGKSPRNLKTNPRILETFSMSRSAWVPNLSDVLPPQSGSGLLGSLTKTADVVSIAIIRFTR